MRRPWFAATVSVALGMSVSACRAQVPGANTSTHTLEVGGRTRTYALHVPPDLPKDRPVALVLALHGGGGNGVSTERLTKFSLLADREGFLVAYPDGYQNNWNDGRQDDRPAIKENIDDIAFMETLIDEVAKQHKIDPKRVYCCGISNGAIFSHYLAAKRSERIAAIGAVAGAVADPFHKEFEPSAPVSVLIVQGTADPLVPYEGGGVAGGRRGKVVSAVESARLWRTHNGCKPDPLTGELPDADPKDGCRVKWSSWAGGKGGTEVRLMTIEGGGHTWPGGPQYLPKALIGPVCNDFNGTDVLWEFFKAHPKP